ncbi:MULTISPECIES: 2-dehydro-3-deoxygalactonokinase [unclassified Sphingomonas]|uniref:2-dehydro-3-deoxygalactonokinase n=1 Tax=unclassified Sphingomonas TaxID=196159 RepID=UPI00083587F0|nr:MULTISPECIES: 2-dehydro-3-deoxygalactonokinase [unclassified Sphingomonas]
MASIVGDWGTTRLRLFRKTDGATERREGPGIGTPGLDARAALAATLDGWPEAERVLLAGMAGARGALVEAGYVACPAAIDDWAARPARCAIGGRAVIVAAGLSCRHNDGAPDVMRGEETQMFGALALMPALACGRLRLLLPGTHAKWVDVADATVTGFRTYPTGEMFALLSRQSTLARGAGDRPDDAAAGFDAGLDRAATPFVAALFEARAAQMLDARSPDWARGFLSGLLIGSEIVAETSVGGGGGSDGRAITVVGDPALCDHYVRALGRFGIASSRIDGEAAVLAGLALLEDWVE